MSHRLQVYHAILVKLLPSSGGNYLNSLFLSNIFVANGMGLTLTTVV